MAENKNTPSTKEIEPSPGFQSIQEEYQWLQNNFNSGAYKPEEFRVIDLVSSLGFKIRRSTEAKYLIQKYTQCKKVLTELFYNRNVFDVVLAQLTAQ